MADSYVPGALTSLLQSTQTNDEPQLKKGKKRKKNAQSIHEAQQSIVENTSFLKIPELPSGSDVIVPKKTKIEEDKNEEKSQKYPPNKTIQRLNRVRKQKVTNAENERTIFVGNAPVSANRKSIRKLFSKFGKIESVRLRSVISGHEKTSKKVAALTNDFSSKMHSLHFYVKFEDVTCAHEALQMNGEIVDAHRLRVDGCDTKKNYNAQTTVFVGNIPFDAEEDQLHTHFEKCGDVSCVRIVRDRNTGMGKGFAFVSFKDTASVPMALKMDGSTFRERQLRITGIQKKKTRMAAATVRVSRTKKPTKRPAVMQRKFSQKANTMKKKMNPEMKSLRKKLKKRKSKKTSASIMS